jgi:hypothetical protein
MELLNADGVICNIIEIEPGANWTPPDGMTLAAPGTGRYAIDMPAAKRDKPEVDLIEVFKTDDHDLITDAFPMLRLKSKTIVLGTKYGSMAFVPGKPGEFTALQVIARQYRGQGFSLAMITSCLAWMFTNTDATLITARVDPANVEALRIIGAVRGVDLIYDPIAADHIVRATPESWKAGL